MDREEYFFNDLTIKRNISKILRSKHYKNIIEKMVKKSLKENIKKIYDIGYRDGFDKLQNETNKRTNTRN